MPDVVILGGGLAGTTAALALADRGLSATIVEARGRLGGRAFSRTLPGDAGAPVEYGGSWGAPHHHRLQALAARLSVGLIPRAELVAQAHEPAIEDATHAMAMAQWRADAAAADPRVLAMTVADYLDDRGVPASARREILAWWTISGATDPTLGSVGMLMSPALANGFGHKLNELAYTIAGGVQGLAEGAARVSGAEVLLSSPAERLTQEADGVRLRLASGREITARAAIVALPVNVLEQIRFDPPLPKAAATLRRKGHAGRVVKVLIRAKGIAPGSLVTGEAAGLRFFWADHLRPDGSTLVVAFALAGDMAEPSAAQARAALTLAFPEAEFLSADWHDWQADPFARGVWAGPHAEIEDLHAAQHWGPFGRMAFAGSDIAPEEQGWFEGALASAERAVTALAETVLST
jgi:monoamine oxidase